MTGKELRRIRHHAGISRRAMARCLGVSAQTIYRWEKMGVKKLAMRVERLCLTFCKKNGGIHHEQ